MRKRILIWVIEIQTHEYIVDGLFKKCIKED